MNERQIKQFRYTGCPFSATVDIPCLYYATKTKKTNQITEYGNKPSKGHRRMDTSEWNNISCKTIRKSFKSCALTTALDGGEDDQIHCFKPEENPFVPILGDIAEEKPTEMLIDKDEEGDEEIDVL